MAFPTVAIGQKIKASWGNTVAARFNEADAALEFSPAGNTDANTGAGISTWLTVGNITVPSWAVSAIVQVNLLAFYNITTADNSYDLRLDIGTDAGRLVTHRLTTIANARQAVGWGGRIALTSTGSKSVTIKANRTAGTGQWRADATSDAIVTFRFLDN